MSAELNAWHRAVAIMVLVTLGCGPGAIHEEQTQDSLRARDQAIINGIDATIDDNPWQVALQDSSGNSFCGGVVLNAEWILTAQHCVNKGLMGIIAPTSVLAGSAALSGSITQQKQLVDEVIVYPGYTSVAQGRDVALLHLAAPLDLTGPHVKAIDMVTQAQIAAGAEGDGFKARVTGWGVSSTGGLSPNILQTLDVDIMKQSTAQSYFPGSVTPDQIAAVAAPSKGACLGDSGGPLTVSTSNNKRALVGIVSWGHSICALTGYPTMYARVSSFSYWITLSISRTNPQLPSVPLETARTVAAPSVVDFNGKTYMLYRGEDVDPKIYMLTTSVPIEQVEWQSQPVRLPDTIQTSDAPAAVAWNGALYVFYKGGAGDSYIYVARTMDGHSWKKARFPTTINTSTRPQPYVSGNTLYVIYKGGGTDTHIFTARLPSNTVWSMP